MREPQLEDALRKTMAEFGLGTKGAADIAEGVNGSASNFTQLDADALLQSTPEGFVELLTSYGVPLAFVKGPGERQLGLSWVRSGFGPGSRARSRRISPALLTKNHQDSEGRGMRVFATRGRSENVPARG